jgi:hypothetical protein
MLPVFGRNRGDFAMLLAIVHLILVNTCWSLSHSSSDVTLRAPVTPMREVKRTMIASTPISAGIALH